MKLNNLYQTFSDNKNHIYLNNFLQFFFINNIHWILIKIHASIIDILCTIYSSNALMIKNIG